MMRLILSLSGLINKWKVIVHQTIPVEFEGLSFS